MGEVGQGQKLVSVRGIVDGFWRIKRSGGQWDAAWVKVGRDRSL